MQPPRGSQSADESELDEVGFCLVEAPTPERARELAERARLHVFRVTTGIVNQPAGGG
jgi:hypothetical protein